MMAPKKRQTNDKETVYQRVTRIYQRSHPMCESCRVVYVARKGKTDQHTTSITTGSMGHVFSLTPRPILTPYGQPVKWCIEGVFEACQYYVHCKGGSA
jgi:hypothetical protein